MVAGAKAPAPALSPLIAASDLNVVGMGGEECWLGLNLIPLSSENGKGWDPCEVMRIAVT